MGNIILVILFVVAMGGLIRISNKYKQIEKKLEDLENQERKPKKAIRGE